jgi:peptidoglycan-associated lipoprotein
MGRLGAGWTVLLACAFAAGCAAPPPAPKPQSYVVLLPNTDGTAGALTVQGAGGQVLLDKAGHAVTLDGASGPYVVEQERIEREFGAAMAARPLLPMRFMLYFETGTAQLTLASQALIPHVLDAVRSRPAADVSVIGHTDTVGSDESNEKLGLERAQAVAEIITKAGLKAHSLTVTSHGERNLLFPTPDNTPEPKNRRVEITVR